MRFGRPLFLYLLFFLLLVVEVGVAEVGQAPKTEGRQRSDGDEGPGDEGPGEEPGADDKLRLTAGLPVRLLVVWSRDWEKCALVIGGLCHAIFDFKVHGGYSINEFPPPNDVWTKGDRKMTVERIRNF